MTGTNIVLIGMPGAGKSTVGVLLAKQMAFDFIDTDLLIQRSAGRRLAQIIRQHGLERFCDLEAAHICGLQLRQTVVATGGSVIYRPQAMVHLRSLGHLIYLHISPDPLKRRLEDLQDRGVVFVPGQSLDDLYAERLPLYQKYADTTIQTDGLSPPATVGAILAILRSDPLLSPLI
jgi:shikimate kinase